LDDIIRKWVRGAEDASDEPGASIERFAAYRNLQRRMKAAASSGIEIPYFQPRDGISGSTVSWQGRELINFSGYNYLGFSGHAEVSEAAKAAIDKYGTSASASRIVSGQIALHNVLEKRLAQFLGTEDALVFVSGYLTNVTVISQLVSRADAVIYDSLAHNSIMTGGRLSASRIITYGHGDWDSLDSTLAASRGEYRRALLVGEGVYSMDGTTLDLERALDLKQRHNLMLMIDEAHSLGTLGATGRGICEAAGISPSLVDVHMGTLSKTLAGCGGYIAGSQQLIDYLRWLTPGFIFSVGLSPPDTAAALAALDLLEREPERPQILRQKVRLFRSIAREWGLPMRGDEESPVASLVVGDSHLAMLLSQKLLEHGVHVQPIVYPAVSMDGARLRFFITMDHTEAQFRATIPAVAREWEQLTTLRAQSTA
jgi:8-amino-7-oxononanoate synthase